MNLNKLTNDPYVSKLKDNVEFDIDSLEHTTNNNNHFKKSNNRTELEQNLFDSTNSYNPNSIFKANYNSEKDLADSLMILDKEEKDIIDDLK